MLLFTQGHLQLYSLTNVFGFKLSQQKWFRAILARPGTLVNDPAVVPYALSPSPRLNRCRISAWDGSAPRIRMSWGAWDNLVLPSFLKQSGISVIKIPKS